MRKANIFILAVVIISFAIGIWFYPSMPDRMASHWNINGEVDGYMPKLWGLFLMPFISVALLLLFVAIPRIDPLKSNIEKFRKYYERFVALVIVFLFYLYLLTLLWSFGFRFNIIQLLSPAFAVLFYYVGILVENAKRNWFIGIRTPWTMSSEKVWSKTHRCGGKLFRAAGVACLLGAVFPDYVIWFILVPVIAVAIYSVVYSYFIYSKE